MKHAKNSSPKKKAAPKKKVAATRPGAKKALKKSPKKPSAVKPPPIPGLGPEIGQVVAFFRIPIVAVVKVTKGPLAVGDRLWIRGHTTNLKLTVDSMQINHRPITEAKNGDEVGVKLSGRARRGDRVHRLTA